MGTALPAGTVSSASAPERPGPRAQPAAHDGHAHEGDEGLRLVAAEGRSRPGPRCERGAPVRRYDVAAIAVEVTLNRYLDHDPGGRMYVLESDVRRVRAEERANAAARAGSGEPALSLGLAGDAIQPLTLRVAQGECLRIRLRNALPGREPASLHLHGAGLRIAGSRDAAVASNPASVVGPGESVDYEWMVTADTREGTRYFHSHGRRRAQTAHGLFGAVIVEPRGSRWLDPATGAPVRTGWAATIVEPSGASFREFAVYYHELGSESFQLTDGAGQLVPLVDPFTSAYRPGARALNYRAEPFMNRLRLQQERTGRADESLSYSSYTFGDPATPIMRTYLGDRVKQRVVHGGSEVFHVHHVHGGSISWPRQPGAEPDPPGGKRQRLLPQSSERTDSQSLGPSETFDVEPECPAGGCQRSPGDYLFHCHVAHHYFAGMWGTWRVYNTLQDGRASTDGLAPLLALPDRPDAVVAAVTSAELGPQALNGADPASVVDRQLPPPGVPRGYDASVLDWRREGDVYVGEPETDAAWPAYRPRAPGTRPPITFDPRTGKLAYPFLRPHLGRRPPFAPNHGPAPYLDPVRPGDDPAAPGASGDGSLCPAGTRLKTFRVHAITLPIALNERRKLVDPAGEIFVLKHQEDAVRADNAMRTPLAIRANAGEDCVDVILANELPDSELNHGFAKVNAHIHFVQFDVQASDGVITGYNYEQSVRPFTVEGERVTSGTKAGATEMRLVSTDRFQPGAVVGVGMDETDTFEVATVARAQAGVLAFERPLRFAHAPGEIVSTEFVRYRWYPDAQFGTAYFHDHVNAIASWRHGLFGALIGEPPGSTYHHPRTGAELDSGPIADVHTGARVSADVVGSFREVAMFVQDDNPLTAVGRSSGSTLNLRAEPLAGRDPELAFSNRDRGDPATPVVESFVGDPIVARVLVGGANDVHTWHVDGHWFRVEPHTRASPPASTVHVGISERYDLVIPRAGGPQALAGDYLYANGRTFKLREGSWGIVRVYGTGEGDGLRPLPGREPPAAGRRPVCPADAAIRRFEVAAVAGPLPMLDGRSGRFFVARGDTNRPPHPLVLHVGVGDCVEIVLSNDTDAPVSLHADMLAYDPVDSAGAAVGRHEPQSAAPGDERTYRFFAHPEVGETVAMLRDLADPAGGPAEGLYGAVVVGPRGSRYSGEAATASSWNVVVAPPEGPAYRDFTLFLHDEDAAIGTHRMPYADAVKGAVGLNYRAGAETPRLEALAGEPVRLHVLAPSSEQPHVFTLEGHEWPVTPGLKGTNHVSSVGLGGLEAITLEPDGGAGGRDALPADYLYGDHREPYREAGLWGILRVRCPGADDAVRPLPGPRPHAPACDRSPAVSIVLPGMLFGAGVVVFAGVRRSRRRRAAALVPLPVG